MAGTTEAGDKGNVSAKPRKSEFANMLRSRSDCIKALTPLDVLDGSGIPVYNLKLGGGEDRFKEMLDIYYGICSTQQNVCVTTSCFSAWNKDGMSNSHAKLIPAVPDEEEEPRTPATPRGRKKRKRKVRVFFFDDNLNLHMGDAAGAAGSRGICNLRDIRTGDYVDYGHGKNGFSRDEAFKHTVVHTSTEYRNVIVQCNILEAIFNKDYFTDILQKYAHEDERMIVYMDINGTILKSDSSLGLNSDQLVVEAMASWVEVCPKEDCPFELTWTDAVLQIKDRLTLKDAVIGLVKASKTPRLEATHQCLELDNVLQLLEDLINGGANVHWIQLEANADREERLNPEDFVAEFKKYAEAAESEETSITESWFRCLTFLKQNHHVAVLNSFGMDTEAVVRRCATSVEKVMRLTVDYDDWNERDKTQFAAQFPICSKCNCHYVGPTDMCGHCRKPRKSTTSSDTGGKESVPGCWIGRKSTVSMLSTATGTGSRAADDAEDDGPMGRRRSSSHSPERAAKAKAKAKGGLRRQVHFSPRHVPFDPPPRPSASPSPS